MLNDILTLDQQWLPNRSDFPPISCPLYRAWPSPIMSGCHGAFATGVASQQGTLTLPNTWFRPPFWDLLVLQLLRPDSSNLPCLYSTFHLEHPLVLSRFCFKWIWKFLWFNYFNNLQIFSIDLKIFNKSPKGHWSLTWVQWALLLKVRFLSKSESMTVKFVKSVLTANNHDISIQDTRMHSVCCCCIPIWRRSPLEKEPLIDPFLRCLGSTSGRICPKSL